MAEAPELLDESPVGGTPAGRAANAALRAFSKAARAFTLYDAQNEAVRRFLQDYRDGLAAFLQAHGPLDLEVRPTELALKGEVVHAERDREKSLASRLHRDGIRRLAIAPQVTWEEELRLLEVLSVRFIGVRQQEEDLVTLLTRAAFRNIAFESVAGMLAAQAEEDGPPPREKHAWPAAFDGEEPPLLPPRQFGYFEIPPSALDAFAEEETPDKLPENAVRMVRELLDDANPEELKTLVPAVEEVRDFLLAEMDVKHLRDLARVVAGQHGRAAATLGPALRPLATPQMLEKLLATVPAGEDPPETLTELLDAVVEYGADLLDPLLDRLEAKADPMLQRLVLRAARGKADKLLERLERASTPAAVEALLRLAGQADPNAAKAAAPRAFAALRQQVEDRDAAGLFTEADADSMGAALGTLAPQQAREAFTAWLHPPQAPGLLGKLKARKPRRLLLWAAAAGLEKMPGAEPAAMLRELADSAQALSPSDDELRKRCLKAMSLQRRGAARG